jgi:hypothetical protein
MGGRGPALVTEYAFDGRQCMASHLLHVRVIGKETKSNCGCFDCASLRSTRQSVLSVEVFTNLELLRLVRTFWKFHLSVSVGGHVFAFDFVAQGSQECEGEGDDDDGDG